MSVTAAHLQAALRSVGGLGGQGWPLSTLANDANEALKQAGITTNEGAAVFIAQCMVESAYFRTTREYNGSSARYAPYYGRGFIQVTWRDNYRLFGVWCKGKGLLSDSNFFVSVPDRLADPKWAWLGAVWYFSTHRHGLVTLANKGDNIRVGRAINRGDAYSRYAAYGEDHRQLAYRALLKAGVSAPGKPSTSNASYTPPANGMSTKEIQKAVKVAVDGEYGAGTKAAVAALQKTLKVPADGKWGPTTEKAYKASLKAPAAKPVAKPAAKIAVAKPATKPAAKIAVDGDLSPATIKALQVKIKTPADGKMGPATYKALQRFLKVGVDGDLGKITVKALQRKVGAKPVDGVWGTGTTKALQRFLNKG